MGYEWHDAVGNLGVALIVLTYLLIQIGRMDPRAMAYPGLNGLGAVLITVSLAFDFNLSAFVIEIAWIAISLYGMWRVARDRRARGAPH